MLKSNCLATEKS